MEKNSSFGKEMVNTGRAFMKTPTNRGDFESDQQKELAQPPLFKEPGNGRKIQLTKDFADIVKDDGYSKILIERKSNRVYSETPISLAQISYLLWSTQIIKEIKGENYATIRPVPSAGARHPFETYLTVFNVEGLERGVYRYLPMEHELEFVMPAPESFEQKTADALQGQLWSKKAGVVFFYAAVPYRCEWRYGVFGHKVMLLDAGHVMQNLYLSCQALGLGTCAIAAYKQEESDKLVGVDGDEEYVIYAAPVGTL